MRRRPPPRSRVDAPLAAEEAAALLGRSFHGARAVLLAVSGGADSTAMLVLAAEWARERGAPRLLVATVDHALRVEAKAETAAVAALAGRLGFEHRTLAAPLAAGASGVEAKARVLRYGALVAHAASAGADAIATAHTLDDQAETVLMRLSAGSGPAGLAAMRPDIMRDGVRHLRPLLGVAKARLVATLRARGVGWAEDVMNADPAFARARLRAGGLALAREGLTPERLATLAARMARAEDALEAATDAAARIHFVRDGDGWTMTDACDLPAEIRLRMLSRAVFPRGEARLERLERLAARIATEPRGAATIAGMRVAWDGGAVSARPAPLRRGGAGSPARL